MHDHQKPQFPAVRSPSTAYAVPPLPPGMPEVPRSSTATAATPPASRHNKKGSAEEREADTIREGHQRDDLSV